MAPSQRPSIEHICEWLTSSVEYVFSTALQLQASLKRPATLDADGQECVRVAITFHGDVELEIVVQVSAKVASNLAGIALEMPPAELDEPLVNDAMGELGNMVAGVVKPRLSDFGLNCTMSLPQLLSDGHAAGKDASGVQHRQLGFEFERGQCLLDVTLTQTA